MNLATLLSSDVGCQKRYCSKERFQKTFFGKQCKKKERNSKRAVTKFMTWKANESANESTKTHLSIVAQIVMFWYTHKKHCEVETCPALKNTPPSAV